MCEQTSTLLYPASDLDRLTEAQSCHICDDQAEQARR
ncbi:hypothetical protein KR100_10835 [Synechococcus sp. KORDI-100]|nr:hypothetical protein KR100_10835 [Synechococcus sp. KORDI-100]